MARLFDNSDSNYLTNASAPFTAAPFTFAGWATFNGFADDNLIIAVGREGSDSHRWQLFASTDPVAKFLVRVTGSVQEAVGTVTLSTGTWYHLAAIEYAANSRAVFTNGADKQTNTTSRIPTNPDVIKLGIRASNTNAHNGLLAECGIWNAALTDAEIAALAKGVSPRVVRPSSLRGYWPVYGVDSPELDYSGDKRHMTVTGTLARGNHAPVVARVPPLVLPVAPFEAKMPGMLLLGVGT